MNNGPVRVLMVCLGNICRSPTAEGVFRQLVAQAQLEQHILVDSAGTSDWHVGEAPDKRTVQAAARRGVDLSQLRGRQVHDQDFSSFDYVLAMDAQNLRDLQVRCPQAEQGKLALFLQYGKSSYTEMPDPYSHGADAFELVLDLVEDASAGLLRHLLATHQFQGQAPKIPAC